MLFEFRSEFYVLDSLKNILLIVHLCDYTRFLHKGDT
nr:MAG TPA: hypothetical protein [Caudoviricetes sp.]